MKDTLVTVHHTLGGEQVRLTVSEFRGNLYMGIRYWLLDINDGGFQRIGFFSLHPRNNITAFYAFTQILSESEVL